MPVTAPDAVDTGQFGILFVGTGNMCWSVIAERQRGLYARLGTDACWFRVTSAGTAGLDGCPVRRYTAEVPGWTPMPAAPPATLTAADVDAADLSLGAGREHMDAVLAIRPGASRHAYLQREFARLTVVALGGAPGRAAVDIPAADEPATDGRATEGLASAGPA